MKLAILKENIAGEMRVVATPDLVKKYITAGYRVTVEQGAGAAAGFPDTQYSAVGASLAVTRNDTVKDAQVILSVQAPDIATIAQLQKDAVVIALLDPYRNQAVLDALKEKNITAFGLELVPRSTRAQSMDVLSSQANLAGYRAVLEAAIHYGHAFPMFMTAAGTVPPARVFVMGAGVAGLQAIATARRLGAIVSATDVRMVAKEQVESLGASFVMVEDDETKAAETGGGYAREMSDAYKAKQAALVAAHIAKQDIVICTALIPGRKAPVLVTDDMVQAMKAGSVLIDLATGWGGNCTLSEMDKVVVKNNVTLVGYSNMAARIPSDASALYGKNVANFLALITDPKGPAWAINWQDDIVAATALTHQGQFTHPQFGGAQTVENAA